MPPLNILDNPTQREARIGPLLADSEDWRTLVVYEGDELLPNPPYACGGRRVAFLRPVTKGTTLYEASARHGPVLNSVRAAIRSATKYGNVQRPQGVLLIDCRGRVALLGDQNGPDQEVQAAKEEISTGMALFGMYGDGETCPSPRGANMHRNWTVCALILGGDFNSRYAAAARAELLARIDHETTKLADLSSVLTTLVATAATLLQTHCCHIRMRSDDGNYLDLTHGIGPVAGVVRRRINISKESKEYEFTAFQAFSTQRISTCRGAEYVQKLKYHGDTAVCTEEQWHAVMSRIEWWMSVPIVERGECLGVLSIASYDPLFVRVTENAAQEPTGNDKAQGQIEKLAWELAARAALPIRATLMRQGLQRALMKASEAKDPKKLADAIVAEGSRLLGRDAYLSLLLPDATEHPTRLLCEGCSQPDVKDAIQVYLGEKARPVDKGICGWVFENHEDWATDDVTEATPADGPCYRECIHGAGIVANYAVPLLVSRHHFFHLADLTNAGALAGKLRAFQERLSSRTQELLRTFSPDRPVPGRLQRAMVDELNTLLVQGCLYDAQRFADVQLSARSRRLLDLHTASPLTEDSLVRLNRFLLEDLFRGQLVTSRPLGVLNVEAPKREAPQKVLDRYIHMPLLKSLAEACAMTITRHHMEQRLWAHLSTLLPRHIHSNLRDQQGEGLYDVAFPKRKIITLLYADIRGYTAMSQIIGEERLLPFIRDYYDRLTGIISEADGTLDKFMGDGVIALYGDIHDVERPDRTEEILRPITSAIRSGLAIAREFKRLAEHWLPVWRRECPEVRSDHNFEIGVAVHTGKPMIGLFHQLHNSPTRRVDEALRENQGAGHLMYTAIGRDVNLVSRIGSEVAENSVWITATTWEYVRNLSGLGFKIRMPPRSFEHLKGIPHVVEAFEVTEEDRDVPRPLTT